MTDHAPLLPLDEEALTDIIEPFIKALAKDGFLVPACQYHGQEHVESNEDSMPICVECQADGGTGELCEVGTDSVAIEIAEAVLKEMNRRAKPAMPSISDEVVRVAQHARCNAEKIYTVQCEYENKEPDYPTMSSRAMRAAIEAAIQAMNEGVK